MKTVIIVCSRKAGDATPLSNSLAENGICPWRALKPVEITDAISMGAGYNAAIRLQAERAKQGPYAALTRAFADDVFVFTHGDVELWAGPKQWEAMLAEARKPTTGFVGVAGSADYLYGTNISFLFGDPDSELWKQEQQKLGAWWAAENLRGSVAHTDGERVWNTTFGTYGPVRVMDGVFLACRREVLEKIGPWPEDLGWHFYDIWATEHATRWGYTNMVVPLPLLHQSVGNVRGDWTESRDLYLRKYHFGMMAV